MMYKKFIFFLLIVLTSLNFAKDYKGAEYRTIEEFVYGRFEVRYKPANRQGVVSSFFTYHNFTNQTGWNEIDIETVGRYSNMFQFNVISPGQKFHIRSNYVSFDPYTDFHNYAFEWTPSYIAYFVDGVEVHRQNGGHVSEIVYPSKIMMNIWNPIYTNWVGEWNDAFLPAFAEYDWVTYSAYTPGTGNYGTNNNFTFEWKDDFVAFNPERWEKSEHTFSGNQCDFIPENVVFNNGIMTLCLTSENNTGFTDVSAPEIIWARENFDNSLNVLFSEEIDPVSGSIPSNYLISGVTVTEVFVHPNKKLVTLNTENYDRSKGYNLIVRSISDDNIPPNTLSFKAANIIKTVPITFPIKVNVGGDEFANYMADQEFSQTVDYGYMQGDVKRWGDIEISNTDMDELFRVERKGIVTYKFRVPNGKYDLKFLFANNSSEFVGEKIFDIIAEGNLVRDNMDVSALAGMSAAYEVQTEVDVTDEIIDIYFPEEIDSNFVNAIEVYQLSTGINKNDVNSPGQFKLFPNYPNPFNGYTTFSYFVSKAGMAEIKIFDFLGREIYKRVVTNSTAGLNSLTWNATDKGGNNITSGVYLVQVINNSQSETLKIVYMK